jgi:hypothetical protein
MCLINEKTSRLSTSTACQSERSNTYLRHQFAMEMTFTDGQTLSKPDNTFSIDQAIGN